MNNENKKVSEFSNEAYKDLPLEMRVRVNMTANELLEIQRKNRALVDGMGEVDLIKGGLLRYISFDRIGQKMEQASFMTPSVYKKNGFDEDAYIVVWWLGEDGTAVESDSNESVQLDFDK